MRLRSADFSWRTGSGPGGGADSAVSWEGCPVASPAFPAPRAWLSCSHLHSQCLMLCRAGSELRSAGRPTSLSSPIRPLLPGSPVPPSRGGVPGCHAVMFTHFLGAGPHLRASEQHWTPGNTWPVVSRLINLRRLVKAMVFPMVMYGCGEGNGKTPTGAAARGNP